MFARNRGSGLFLGRRIAKQYYLPMWQFANVESGMLVILSRDGP